MDSLLNPSGDAIGSMLGLLVFVTTTLAALGIMGAVRARGLIKRRAAGISIALEDGDPSGGLRQSSLQAMQRLIDYANKHYATLDDASLKLLRRRLVQAGIFDPRAVGYFFVIRIGLALGLAAALFFGAPIVVDLDGSALWLMGVGGILGYIGPSIYLDRLIKARQYEYRAGFPDFMDLLVVCADAGLAMEASLERVGRELADSYPALAANIHMTNLEIRAGRALPEALEHFGDRLGLEEVRAFATLIQQSEELGSSITEALRVYSEDMRHKRLSRAEEKAYSLPARLALPMMICIFPVLFVVILLPVVVRFKMGAY
jgi:tight adherence protein C